MYYKMNCADSCGFFQGVKKTTKEAAQYIYNIHKILVSLKYIKNNIRSYIL